MTFGSVRLKFLLSRSDAGVWGEDPGLVSGEKVLRSTDISLEGEINSSDPAVRKLNYRELRATRVARGDILVVKSSGSDAHLGKSGWVDDICAGMSFSNFIQRLRVASGVNPRFLWYFLNCSAMKDQIRLLSSTSTGLQNLSASLLGEIEVPRPDWEEQCRIVSYLDAHLGWIDELRDAVRMDQRVSLLAKRVTYETVFSRGGARRRAGYLFDLVTSGPRGWGEHVGMIGRPFFRSANLCRDSILPSLDGLVRVDPPRSAAVEARRSAVRSGDILVGITGANAGWVSLASDDLVGASVSQHVCLVRPGCGIDSEWLAYALSAPRVQESLLGSQYGGTKTQLSLADIRDLSFPIPSIAEQQVLARQVRDTVADFETRNHARAKQAALLVERRQALVTAVVAGQADVSTASGVAV